MHVCYLGGRPLDHRLQSMETMISDSCDTGFFLSSSLWVANRPQVTALTTGVSDSFELWRILRATGIAPYRHQALQCYQKYYMLKKDFMSEVESGCRNCLGP
jgi:hypothetical protein